MRRHDRATSARRLSSYDGSKDAKALTLEDEDMRTLEADPADVRDALDQYGLGDVIGDMDDEEMMDFAGRLHDDIMDLLAESDDTEMATRTSSHNSRSSRRSRAQRRGF